MKSKILFDKKNERIDLDLKRYVSRHNLVYRNRIENPADGLPVVTGKCGAAAWHSENGLCMQINNVDGSPHTQFSSGQVFIESDALSKPLVSTLDLYSGEAVFDFEQGQIRVSGGCGDSYFAVSISAKKSADFKICLHTWEAQIAIIHSNDGKINNSMYVKDPADWKDFSYISGRGYTGVKKESRSGAGVPSLVCNEDVSNETIFGFKTAIGTDNAAQEVADNGVITLNANKFTLYIVNPSKFESEFNMDVFFEKLPIYEKVYSKNASFWENFWQRRIMGFTEQDSDYIENIYYLSQYIFEGAMLGKYPMQFINGNLRSCKDDNLKWSAGYWWYNERCLYGGMLSSGNYNELKTLLDFYYDNQENFAVHTRKDYPDSKGFRVPETTSWCAAPCVGSWGAYLYYTQGMFVTGIEIALLFHKLFLFSGDARELDRFKTFGRGIAEFYLTAVLSDENGVYKIPAGCANAREEYWGIENPVTELAGIKIMFPLLAEHCGDKAFGERLNDAAARLAPFETGGCPERYLAGVGALEFIVRNTDEAASELLYPFDFPVDKESAYLLNNTFEHRHGRDQIRKTMSWDYSAIWAARLFRGDEMYACLADKIVRVQIYANGTGTDGNCVYEYNGHVITALNESMLDCRGGIIRVFPAVPKNKQMEPFFKLHAPGGFIVSSEYAGIVMSDSNEKLVRNCAKYVAIEAARNGVCRLYNPWGKGSRTVMENLSTGTRTLSDEEILSFNAEEGMTYFISPENMEFVSVTCEIPPPKEKVFSYDGYTAKLGN